MNKFYYWSDSQVINKLKNTIRNNEIVITSTDTILGFLGNTTKESFEKIVTIKGREENKPFLILISDPEKLKFFIDEKNLKNKNLLRLLEKHWPGPLTIIFKAKKNSPNFLQSNQNTIAIRCPEHKELQQILEHFNGLFSTSANKAGESVPKNHTNLNSEILENIKLIVIKNEDVDTKNKLYQTLPSTIIDASDEKIKVIRKGAYPIKDLEETYGTKFEK